MATSILDPVTLRSGIKGVESLSLEHAANLYAGAGQRGQAAALYRRALQLDADAKDDKAAALDWFAYAQSLNDAGQPKTMVLACTLKSESLLAEGSAEEVDAVRQYMEPLKARLGRDAVEKVRQDTDSLVGESLKVKFELSSAELLVAIAGPGLPNLYCSEVIDSREALVLPFAFTRSVEERLRSKAPSCLLFDAGQELGIIADLLQALDQQLHGFDWFLASQRPAQHYYLGQGICIKKLLFLARS